MTVLPPGPGSPPADAGAVAAPAAPASLPNFALPEKRRDESGQFVQETDDDARRKAFVQAMTGKSADQLRAETNAKAQPDADPSADDGAGDVAPDPEMDKARERLAYLKLPDSALKSMSREELLAFASARTKADKDYKRWLANRDDKPETTAAKPDPTRTTVPAEDLDKIIDESLADVEGLAGADWKRTLAKSFKTLAQRLAAPKESPAAERALDVARSMALSVARRELQDKYPALKEADTWDRAVKRMQSIAADIDYDESDDVVSGMGRALEEAALSLRIAPAASPVASAARTKERAHAQSQVGKPAAPAPFAQLPEAERRRRVFDLVMNENKTGNDVLRQLA